MFTQEREGGEMLWNSKSIIQNKRIIKISKHKELILMYGCYVEVVFHFVAKVTLHTLSFLKMFFNILMNIISPVLFNNNNVELQAISGLRTNLTGL